MIMIYPLAEASFQHFDVLSIGISIDSQAQVEYALLTSTETILGYWLSAILKSLATESFEWEL